jgi:hypothetical protein
MPTFYVWPIEPGDQESFWVYAIDDWDARSQIATALGIEANDEASYGCAEDNRFTPPLNIIVHSCGELTGVRDPTRPRAPLDSPCDDDC